MKPNKLQLDLLLKIYNLYDAFAKSWNLACTQGCATCCTRNVTLCSLEAVLILNHLDATRPNGWQPVISAAAALPRFQPKMTANQLVDLCVKDEPLPEEEMDPYPGPCPLLTDNICTVYAVRPFACRAMASTAVCSAGSSARMPEFILTVNNVILQYVESIDSRGVSGNMIDVLLFLNAAAQAPMDIRRLVRAETRGLLTNRSLSVLMIPPEHRLQIAPLLQKIQDLCKGL